MPHFADRLMAAVVDKSSAVLVGLDPRRDRLPNALTPPSTSHEDTAASYRRFCHGVLDVVADLVAVVKPQAAFFEQLGPPGMLALADVIQYARQKDLLVVLDGKRNDIGSTAEAYADAYLGPVSAWQADALTVSPYLGDDSLTPFVEVACQRDAGVFVLVKTSNPGGKRWQDAESHGATIYEHVADYVEELAVIQGCTVSHKPRPYQNGFPSKVHGLLLVRRVHHERLTPFALNHFDKLRTGLSKCPLKSLQARR